MKTSQDILASTVVLEGESKDRFLALLANLIEELQPETTVECHLVETMAVSRWRLMRLWAIEKASLTHEIQQQEPADPSANPMDTPTKAALAVKSLSDDSRSLELLNRYETRNDFQYNRALTRLMKHRISRDFSRRTQL